jgi:hypothetical protein
MTTTVHLSHASGYLALGMLNEATEELALIAAGDQGLPSVLAARIDLHTAKKEWDTVIGFGEQLATRCPKLEAGWISWAYALRELNRVEEAKAVLLEAEPIHGKSGILHYNLACYYCLLGDAAEDRAAAEGVGNGQTLEGGGTRRSRLESDLGRHRSHQVTGEDVALLHNLGGKSRRRGGNWTASWRGARAARTCMCSARTAAP